MIHRLKHTDFFFKIIIVGEYKTGKTSLLCRYMNQELRQSRGSTATTVDFSVKTIQRQDAKIKLQIWDTAGQERFRTAVANYYRGAKGVLFVYDITNRQSFYGVGFWYEEMKRNCDPETVKGILVGNKCHLECDRDVSSEEGKKLAEQFDIPFYETSAEKNINVEECFNELVDSILTGIKQTNFRHSIEASVVPDSRVHVQQVDHERCGC